MGGDPWQTLRNSIDNRVDNMSGCGRGKGREGVQGLTYATNSKIDTALLMLMLAACLQGKGVTGA